LEGSTSFLQLASNVGALQALDSRNFDYQAEILAEMALDVEDVMGCCILRKIFARIPRS
jgi:hypothetical protein